MSTNTTSFERYLEKVITQVKATQHFREDVEHKVTSGAEMGDGYSSKKYILSLTEEDSRHEEFFLKCYPFSKTLRTYTKMFKNETTFYEKIRPAFHDFEVEREIKDPLPTAKYFDVGNVVFDDLRPKPIVLENLKLRKFALRDRQVEADENHMDLALRSYASFHAISFAMQDQTPELYEKLANEVIDVYYDDVIQELGFDKIIESLIDTFLNDLDPEDDQKILNALKGSVRRFGQYMTSKSLPAESHSVLLHGDAWSNNMMFLYDDEGKKPVDVMLIDYQFMRVNSPVIDLSYFFYSTASEEMMANLDRYMKKYHQFLSERIEKLGSDPKKLYSFETFKEHWKKYSVFGFSFAFFLVKIMLYQQGEVPNYVGRLDEDSQSADMFSVRCKKADEFQQRMKNVCLHFIENNFL